jgi:hypothetical protein
MSLQYGFNIFGTSTTTQSECGICGLMNCRPVEMRVGKKVVHVCHGCEEGIRKQSLEGFFTEPQDC